MEAAFYSADDIAAFLHTTRASVYKLMRRGRLPFVRQGRRVLIPRPAWEAFVTAQTQAALQNLEVFNGR